MCGITAYWAIESTLSPITIEKLLEYGEKRGTDALGYCVFNDSLKKVFERKLVGLEDRSESSFHIINNMCVGSLMIANHRAAPETESMAIGYKNIQPITNPYDEMYGISLTHNGSVSNRIVMEFAIRSDYQTFTSLDSEAIIKAYLSKNRNMKEAMEYLSGGFAFLMLDSFKRKLYAVCTHNPLYCGYVRGSGLLFSNFSDAIYDTISLIKGHKVERQNTYVWEDYYVREMPENCIVEFDLDSRCINEIKFTPRYIHPKYDPFENKKETKERVLVAASGGLDSTTTLAVLKHAGYDVTAVHFKYGHRGGRAEEIAITKICEVLDIPVVKFDIVDNMKILDNNSMLTNPDHKITTGTNQDLKTTIAWTCFRNGLFLSYMGALAESLIINEGYTKVYLAGGFMNLTESGSYPDNSERFMNAFTKFTRFASIVGTKIEPLYCCSNLLKCEQYVLLDELKLLHNIGEWLISCDRPTCSETTLLYDVMVANCSKNGLPACGSGLLSYWAAKLAGIKDPRRYYEVRDKEYIPYEHKGELKSKDLNIYRIIDKLLIPEELRFILTMYIDHVNGYRKE